MTKIQIINGVFGFNAGNGVVPKTPNDDPFDVADEKVVKRLISQKVAVIVEETTPAKEKADDAAGDGDKKLYTDNTKFEELLAIAKKLGATEEELKPIRSKAAAKEFIDNLVNKKEDAETDETGSDDSEDAPDFNDNGVA